MNVLLPPRTIMPVIFKGYGVMKVSKLSDVELNRAMFWLYMNRVDSFLDHNFKLGLEELSEANSINDDGFGLTIKLNNWEWSVEFLCGYLAYDLTMPLAVENNLNIFMPFDDGNAKVLSPSISKLRAYNKNPLRAICEVLVTLCLNLL